MQFTVTGISEWNDLLQNELKSLNITIKKHHAGVFFCEGTLQDAYRVCLESFLANRVLLLLKTVQFQSIEELHRGVKRIPWYDHFDLRKTFSIHADGTNQLIRNTQYAAQVVKDGLVDSFRERTNRRPSVEKTNPDIRIHVFIGGHRAEIALELSGSGLHQRGYRKSVVEAPIRENVAAALLQHCGWPQRFSNGALLDPMCGSGTFLIEGAMMALKRAPGLIRESFGLEAWKQHQPEVWQELVRQARKREKEAERTLLVYGWDWNPRAVEASKVNIRAAGLSDFIQVAPTAWEEWKLPHNLQDRPCLLMFNPPYGKRIGTLKTLREHYQRLDQHLRQHAPGLNAGVIIPDARFLKVMQHPRLYQGTFVHGGMERHFNLFGIPAKAPKVVASVQLESSPVPSVVASEQQESSPVPSVVASQQQESTPPPTDQVDASDLHVAMFVNRLRKNQRKLQSWIQREAINCYRLYDADLPEFAVAVDMYEDQVHVQEYAAPSSIDEEVARQRLSSVLAVLPEALGVNPEQMHVKTRRKQLGRNQYEKLASEGSTVEVQEGAYRFLVNLSDYLDTGLFLDHRITRQILGELAKQKDVLNLFAYTGSATVYAAGGGAKSTVTVDLSNTYLDWAKQNLKINGLLNSNHQFERADCLRWLKKCRKQFDLIFLDPPTFSNSTSMEETFDLQRDHVGLIQDCLELLRPKGILVFSNNRKKFKLDPQVQAMASVEDITQKTIPPDFKRSPNIHHCFVIRTGV